MAQYPVLHQKIQNVVCHQHVTNQGTLLIIFSPAVFFLKKDIWNQNFKKIPITNFFWFTL